MLNIEKYKDEIIEEYNTAEPFECLEMAIFYIAHNLGEIKSYSKTGSFTIEQIMNWLCSEYKEPILTNEEREYLSNVIKPFRDSVTTITKLPWEVRGKEHYEYIQIKFNTTLGSMVFPYFKKGTMYKWMEQYRKYTLKELGL